MSDIADLIAELRRRDIVIALKDDRLVVNAPKGALTPDLQERLRAAKPQLLAYLAGGGSGSADVAPRPVPRDALLPASFGQERLWLVDRWHPGSPGYLISSVIPCTLALDAGRLRAALATLVARHEALRTTLIEAPAAAACAVAQVVRPAQAVELVERDLRSLGDAAETAAEAAIGAEAATAMDLRRGPLLRATLLLLPTRSLVQITVHHAVFDGWSGGILARELAECYAGTSLSAPVLQYADAAAWLRGRDLAAGLLHWKRRLAGLATLDLPTDFPRPPDGSEAGDRLVERWPRELVENLRRLARGEGATLFQVIAAGFAAVLGRHAGQTDIALGMPVAGRDRPEFAGIVGLFVNLVVLRLDLGEQPSVHDLITRARDAVRDALAAAEVPFEKVVEALQPRRDPSRTPLFQVLINLEHATSEAPPAGWPQASAGWRVGSGTALFDCSLNLVEDAEGITATWEYSTDLFAPASIGRLAGHLRTLLAAAAVSPTTLVADLPLLTPTEHEQLTVGFNRTDFALPAGATLHGLIAEQMARTPSTIAVRHGELTLTYRELSERAARCAAGLRVAGVVPGDLIGVCLDRGLDLLPVLLGILAAGGAYVPLDPAFPAARLALMVEDARMRVVVAEPATDVHLPPGDYPRLHAATLLAATGDPTPTRPVRGDDLAYVLFTSGSTGRPKGVQLEHGNLINFLAAMPCLIPALGSGCTVLAITTLSFDISVLELFLPLAMGGTVVMAGRDEARDPRRIADLVRHHAVDVVQATPATWRMLADAGLADLPVVKISGGEPLPPELARALLGGGRGLWNVYGPTETTVWSTVEAVTAVDGAPSVGRPIANTRIYVLDAARRLVPIGVRGEVYIGGLGVARGYLGRDDLTAERFLPDPFHPGSRMYRTGDVGWMMADGRLQLSGRGDHQVKIRGFRIELGDIESALVALPMIARAVVMARDDGAGDRRLAAYCVATNGVQPTAGELRAALAERLPGYMVPNSFTWLDALPLTPNGKIDRNALPAPETAAPAGAVPEPPANPAEAALAGIIASVLALPAVGRSDNFYDLGGHSLLSLKVVDRVAAELGWTMHPGELMRQTVAQIAAHHAQHAAAAR